MEEESGELDSSSAGKPLTFSEYADEMCAYYMSIGVSYDEYWHGNYAALEFRHRAFELQRERDRYDIWTQGGYFYDALCFVSPIMHAFAAKNAKPAPYHREPYGKKKAVDPETAKAEFLDKWKSDKNKWKRRKAQQANSEGGETNGGND